MNNNIYNLHNSNNINFQGHVGKSAKKYINQCCEKELDYLTKRATYFNQAVSQDEIISIKQKYKGILQQLEEAMLKFHEKTVLCHERTYAKKGTPLDHLYCQNPLINDFWDGVSKRFLIPHGDSHINRAERFDITEQFLNNPENVVEESLFNAGFESVMNLVDRGTPFMRKLSAKRRIGKLDKFANEANIDTSTQTKNSSVIDYFTMRLKK